MEHESASCPGGESWADLDLDLDLGPTHLGLGTWGPGTWAAGSDRMRRLAPQVGLG